ncbi:hypothetical protein [Streptomyces millisiae]|uniref:HTH cro/C1-type domain-containing protein n=1 Tax=Streptomyces millisiae TaxID=3075542 RepID=A0ABU2LNX0_9ACTN|nr:hypothetical protein [Streptomyces sp. DSM 44918]MDT0319294.1 hypothetical protein [Streptomyces sp. DSM 44918]
MPGTQHIGTRSPSRTLAEKLQWLRDLRTPRGEQPPSYEMTARQITELTGVSISGPYFWELVTGRTTNPKLHHLQALAQFFNVPVGYLADTEAHSDQFESELELLHALKSGGVRDIKLQGIAESKADVSTIQGLLGKLQLLETFGGEEVRETALRLQGLDSGQRRVLDEAATDAGFLTALQVDSVREIAVRASQLSEGSQQAVLALVRHLHSLEKPGAD